MSKNRVIYSRIQKNRKEFIIISYSRGEKVEKVNRSCILYNFVRLNTVKNADHFLCFYLCYQSPANTVNSGVFQVPGRLLFNCSRRLGERIIVTILASTGDNRYFTLLKCYHAQNLNQKQKLLTMRRFINTRCE